MITTESLCQADDSDAWHFDPADDTPTSVGSLNLRVVGTTETNAGNDLRSGSRQPRGLRCPRRLVSAPRGLSRRNEGSRRDSQAGRAGRSCARGAERAVGDRGVGAGRGAARRYVSSGWGLAHM